jgi:hypothetical protein
MQFSYDTFGNVATKSPCAIQLNELGSEEYKMGIPDVRLFPRNDLGNERNSHESYCPEGSLVRQGAVIEEFAPVS